MNGSHSQKLPILYDTHNRYECSPEHKNMPPNTHPRFTPGQTSPKLLLVGSYCRVTTEKSWLDRQA